MKVRITTNHADYHEIFLGEPIIVEGNAKMGFEVAEAANPACIGNHLDVASDTPEDLAAEFAAMYSGEAEML